ncbi:MAG: TVP38/TMEM64 family protein [Archangium sp.]
MSGRWKIAILALLMIGGAFVGRLVLGERFEATALIAALRDFGSASAAIPLYFLLFGVATTVLTPAVAFMAAAGVTWGFFPGWLIVWVTANVWTHAQFAAGRLIGAHQLERWLEDKGGGFVARELSQGGVIATILVRQLPLPFIGVNLAAGATAIRWQPWIVGNALGLLPNCLIYTSLAAAIVDGAQGAREQAAIRALISAASIITLGLFTRWLQRRFGHR